MPHSSNIRYIGTPKKRYQKPDYRQELREEAERERAEWLERQMRKIYFKDEVDQVLTNRRSEYSDERLIADFKESDQPLHPIPKDYNYDRAVKMTTEHFRPARTLNPVHYPDLRYYPWPLSISAETPWTSEGFRFVPAFRDLDSETTKPKFGGAKQRAEKWKRFAQFVHRNFGSGTINVLQYLKLKQRFGLIDNSRTTFHNLYDEMFQYNRGRVHNIKDGEGAFWKDGEPQPYFWNMLHARSHVVGKDEPDKIRAVFGATKLLLMIELMFIWPLQASYLNGGSGRMLWGYEMTRGGWKKLYNEMHKWQPFNTIIGIDWSKFDKRLLHELIDQVHQIWRSYFSFERYEPTSKYPNAKTDPARLERLWRWMCHAIRRTPIMLPNGELWEWFWNGFGSGYQQTQLMDTFCNCIMVYTCLSALGINIESDRFWSKFQGDDSLIGILERMYFIYGNHFLDMLAESAMHYFNAKLNVKKSDIQNKVTGMTVLSYSNKFGICSRTEEDLLRHLYFPERERDYAKLAASAVGLAIAAGGEHERFHRLCEKIFVHITKKWNLQPKWKAIQWMIRAHHFGSEEELYRAKFPDRLKLMAEVYSYKERSESEKQRQWPTYAKEEGDFYFLEPVLPVSV